MIAIVDYGLGNLFSLCASLDHLGIENTVSGDPSVLCRADKIILPGVGAFGDAVDKLKEAGLFCLLQQQKKPMLGICLGMQLLFEKSFEYGEHDGLGLIPGEVCSLAADVPSGVKVPHMGWNALRILQEDPLLAETNPGTHVYFVHSFYAKNCAPFVLADAHHGVSVPAVVRNGTVWGAQFHPEKSGPAGLSMLKAFAALE